MWLLAQEVVKTQPNDPVGWFLQGGALGILALLAWFLVWKAIPAIREDRRELVDAFKSEMKSERETFKAEVEQVRTRADARSDRMTARLEVSINSLKDELKDNTMATRDLAHATKDNTSTMKRNGH